MINPILEIPSNTQVKIKIEGTCGNHNFVIETLEVNQLVKTKDFGKNKTQLSFTPKVTNTTLIYYSEPHLDTMKGMITVK